MHIITSRGLQHTNEVDQTIRASLQATEQVEEDRNKIWNGKQKESSADVPISGQGF